MAPNDDDAIVAGAIVLFAAEVILRSSKDLLEARAYLAAMQTTLPKSQSSADATPEPAPRSQDSADIS